MSSTARSQAESRGLEAGRAPPPDRPSGVRETRGALRGLLRERTREAHERTEAAFSFHDVTEPEGYVRFLLSHAAVVPTVEDALTVGGAQTLLPDWSKRRRTPALLSDLAQLGLIPPHSAVNVSLHGRERMLGALYVLEGSRLGAAVLVARMVSRPALASSAPRAYLNYGAGERLWASFLRVLDEFRGDERSVVEGALITFDLFETAARSTVDRL